MKSEPAMCLLPPILTSKASETRVRCSWKATLIFQQRKTPLREEKSFKTRLGIGCLVPLPGKAGQGSQKRKTTHSLTTKKFEKFWKNCMKNKEKAQMPEIIQS